MEERKISRDTHLTYMEDDPRVKNGKKLCKQTGAGRNTESFDPSTTIVRPDMRILVGKTEDKYSGQPLKHGTEYCSSFSLSPPTHLRTHISLLNSLINPLN